MFIYLCFKLFNWSLKGTHKNIDIMIFRSIFRSVFKSFKTSWGEIVHELASATGVAVRHERFFRTMKKAWESQ